MRGPFAGVIALLAVLAGCGGGSGTPSLPATPAPRTTLSPAPGGGGAPPPVAFNPAKVKIAEIPVPTESPASNGPVLPGVIDVASDGSVYFGQLNAGLSSSGNFGLFRYLNGAITQTLPFALANQSFGGVDGIDAHDSSTVIWSSSYQSFDEPLSFGDYLECGNGGVATQCAFKAMGGFVNRIVTAKDGTIWTAGSACCGGGAAGYPAQLPVDAAFNAFSLDIANGPGGNVWGVLQFNGPIFEFSSTGAVLNTYPLPAGTMIVGGHVLIEGADGALWLTDSGHNAILRVSSSGQVTQYAIPTPNSGVQSITLAADGGMWFTETSANKIGRIDSTGKIYEFPLSTPNAGPSEIAAAPQSCTCSTSQVWFTETNANKLASATY